MSKFDSLSQGKIKQKEKKQHQVRDRNLDNLSRVTNRQKDTKQHQISGKNFDSDIKSKVQHWDKMQRQEM